MKKALLYFFTCLLFLQTFVSEAQINEDIPVAVANPTLICNGQTSSLEATSISGYTQFNWYISITEETPIASGATFETPKLTTTTTFYLASMDSSQNESIRTPVIITVLPSLDSPIGLAEDPSICAGSSTLLSVQAPNALYTYRWYSSPTDTVLLDTGLIYQTPTLFTTTTYYVASVNDQSCESARTPVIVTVLPEPTLPLALPDNAVVCQQEITTIRVQNVNNEYTYYWYQELNDDVALDSGVTFITPPLTESINYFVVATNSEGCQSIRSSVSIAVTPAIDAPFTAAEPAAVCSGKKSTLTATSVLNTTFRWYYDVLDTASFYEGDTFQTPPLNETSTYYVSSVSDEGCESIKTPIGVIVTPSADIVSTESDETNICSGFSTFITTSSQLDYTSFFWYAQQGDTLWLDTGAVFTTPLLYETTTYWVASADENDCMSMRTPTTITVVPNADSPTVVNFPEVLCEKDTAQLTALTQDPLNTFVWYNSLTDTVIQSTEDTLLVSLGEESTSVFVASKNSLGCESDRTEVVLDPTPQIILDAPVLRCNNGVIIWDEVEYANSYEYRWKESEWKKLSTTQVSGYANALIYVRATSNEPCALPIGPSSNITCASNNKIPNIITPNGDEINDYWILPERFATQANEIKVLNENGKLVFEASNYNNISNLFGGSDVFGGTYFYQITLTQTGEDITGYLTALK
jgi:gliding motility-associated-like protein